jgi:hypothetical protein
MDPKRDENYEVNWFSSGKTTIEWRKYSIVIFTYENQFLV